MARYEFQEGTSSKFWEIELEGSSFTVRWGRLGTAGQSQVKGFATPAKAQAEHDKLVKEKTGKGYQLVGGAAPAAGAPATSVAPKASPPATAAAAPKPAPAPAPPPPARVPATAPQADASGLRVVWTDAGRRRVHPRPGTGFKAPKVDLAKRFKEVSGRFQELAQALAVGEKKDALVKAIRRRYEAKAPEPPLVVEEEAAAAAFGAAWYGPQGDSFVDYWVGQEGVAFAVDALCTSWSFDRSEGMPRLLRKAADCEAFGYGRTYGFRVLRRHLAGAEPGAHQAAREVAHRHWDGAPAKLKCGLAYLFPLEQGWAREACEALLGSSYVPGYGVIALASLADPELLARFVAGLRPGHLDTMMAETPAQEYACTLVDGLGPAAFAPLRTLFELGEAAAPRRAFAEALAQLEGEPVAALFRPLHDDRFVKGTVADYFTRHPHLREAGGPAAPRQAAAARPPAAEASADALPPVLASPPWLSARKAQPPAVVKDLPLLPYDERIDFPAGFRPEPPSLGHADWALETIRTRIAGSGTVNFFYLLRVPAEQAVALLREHPPTAWYSPEPDEILKLMHHAGLASIEAVARLAEGQPQRALETVARVDSPRVAARFADALARLRKLRSVAESWLLAHPRAAAIGLLPAAVGPAGKARESAGTALRLLAVRGHADVLRTVADAHGAPARAALEEVLAQDPLGLFPARLPKLPAFWNPGAWPRPRLRDGGALPLAAVEHLGTMLSFSTLEEPYAGLGLVKQACDAASLAEFGWGLFEAWSSAGFPPKENWAFLALGHLGDDETARRLTPLLRAWPGEGGSARAALGLDVLAAIGTDLALMHLHGISQKVKFKALQDRAQEKIAQIAEARGMSEEELADRLVPDLGLDRDGSRQLDYGARSFRVGFDEQLRPFVTDAERHRLGDLPRPGKADDAARAEQAASTWKALKKDARAIADGQVLRLERAMGLGRRWDAAAWRTLFVEHPLLLHLVRRLVWGSYAEGQLAASFRVAEDGSLAGPDDAPFQLPAAATVGIAHPLELSAELRQTWGNRLADYEILQPFPQLGRSVAVPTAKEAQAKALVRFSGRQVGFGKVLALERRGWRRGTGESGVVLEMVKALPGGLRASLPLEPGIYVVEMGSNQDQTVGDVTVVDGEGAPVVLGRLGAVAFSELVFDLEILAG